MADRTPLRAATPNDIADDDPFAELTRIMGFDPREPAKTQDNSLVSDRSAMNEDFEIDLEKELMGEFGDADAAQDAHVVQADPVSPVDHGVPEEHAHDVPDFDFSEEIAASLEPASEPYAETFDPRAYDEAPHAADAIAPQIEGAAEHDDFDAAITQSLADDLASVNGQADYAVGDFEPVPEPAEEDAYSPDNYAPELVAQAPVESPTALSSQDGWRSDDLDRAVAEDDLDFGADAEWADLEAAIESDAAQVQAATSFEHDPFDGDFELDLQSELEAASQPTDGEASGLVDFVETYPVEPVSADVSPEPDTTLEDELNALLNRMSAKPAVSPAAAEVLQPVPDEAIDPAPWAAAGQPAHEVFQEQSFDTAAFSPDDVSEADFGELADIEIDHDAFAAALNEDVAGNAETFQDGAAYPDTVDVPPVSDPVTELSAFVPHSTSTEAGQSWLRSTPFIQPQFAQEAASADSYSPAAEPEVAAVAQPTAPVSAAPRPEMPEVETVEVPERVVALADDLDIPEFTFEDKASEAPVFDDIDADFAGLLNEMNDAEPAPVAARATTYDDDAYEAGFRHDPIDAPAYGEQRAAPIPAGAAAAATAYAAASATGYASPRAADRTSYSGGSAGMDNLDYDPNLDDEMSVPDAATIDASRQPRNRGLMLAAVVGAVAIVGGIGAFALSFGGGSETGAPVLIKADNQPIKVKPENPGGTVIPNQDNKVYDVVANGAKPAAPEQKKLVADAQEPVDVNARVPLGGDEQPAAEEVAAGQKSEARLQPTEQKVDESENTAVAAVAPRKVRTMIVKPDGTLVPREEAEPAANVAAGEPADPAPQHVVNASSEDQTGAVPQTANGDTQNSQMPQTAPVAPPRPADQPVDIVGEVKPETVASIAPDSTGGWSMQIASQPSVESAQKTYQNLSRRYESVLSGHEANIVKAEIAGKGTFYRVRVPAKSRDEAINLCTSYKAAGGNCFVSK